MKIPGFGLAIAVMLLAAGVARADGLDPVLVVGGGHGSPGCVSYQAFTNTDGSLQGACNNTGSTDITSFSFEILAANVEGNGVITPTLDDLLAPFANTPLSALDWTASCAISGGIYTCTAMQSTAVANAESLLCSTDFATVCSTLSSLSASQMELADPGAFASYGGDPCLDPLVYVIFGIIPGCDITASAATGSFADDVAFDITPAGSTAASLPEPSSLSLLLIGLSGLPFLRRRLAR